MLPGESRGEISGVLFGGYQILISEGSEYPFDRRAQADSFLNDTEYIYDPTQGQVFGLKLRRGKMIHR